MLVGLDEQLLRGQPRAEILVKRGTQLRIEGDAAGDLVIDLPKDPPANLPADLPADTVDPSAFRHHGPPR